MSLAPSIAVPRTRFNPLPIYIGVFCLLWSYAFVAGKIGVTHCPPLILLAARFSLAGILILGISAFQRDGCAGRGPDRKQGGRAGRQHQRVQVVHHLIGHAHAIHRDLRPHHRMREMPPRRAFHQNFHRGKRPRHPHCR